MLDPGLSRDVPQRLSWLTFTSGVIEHLDSFSSERNLRQIFVSPPSSWIHHEELQYFCQWPAGGEPVSINRANLVAHHRPEACWHVESVRGPRTFRRFWEPWLQVLLPVGAAGREHLSASSERLLHIWKHLELLTGRLMFQATPTLLDLVLQVLVNI